MFASAFYLVGFGHYLNDLFEEAGIPLTIGVLHLAVAAAVVLTGIALTGAEKTGNLQNNLVGVLIALFTVFLGYGLLDAFGLVGSTELPDEFLPFGTGPAFTTAALVFTSYLGFAQIATVAGDVRDPGRSYHLIVLDETDPGDPDVVLGRLPRNVASRTQRPVIVVRSPGDEDDGEAPAGPVTERLVEDG